MKKNLQKTNKLIQLMMMFVIIQVFPQIGFGQNSPEDILYCINGCEYITAHVPYLSGINSKAKPGWNLIFDDEFSCGGISPVKWELSTYNDDGDYTKPCDRNFIMDPRNVSPGCNLENTNKGTIPPLQQKGYAVISNKVNTLSPPLNSCGLSKGEMKSFSSFTEYQTKTNPNDQFKSYYFYNTGYFEARVKLFNAHGQGASMWLYSVNSQGQYSEIDVFEIGGEYNNKFDASYHWGSGKQVKDRTHVISLADGYNLTDNWTTFAVEWDVYAINWYVNNVLVKSLDLTGYPPFCKEVSSYGWPIYPMSIRFGTGANSVGHQGDEASPYDMPQNLLIDYVRVYKKANELVCPIEVKNDYKDICYTENSLATSNEIMKANYFPGVSYDWFSSAFSMEYLPYHSPTAPENLKFWVNSGTTPNNSYPIYLHNSLFPEPTYSEDDNVNIWICGGTPNQPSLNTQFTCHKEFDKACTYEIIVLANDSHLHGCEYRDGGNNWIPGTLKTINGSLYCCFGSYDCYGSTIHFDFRKLNACSNSNSPYYSGSRIISDAPDGCLNKKPGNIQTNTFLPNVKVSPNPMNNFITISIKNIEINGANPLSLKLYDVTGKIVMKKTLRDLSCKIDVSQLTSNIYYLVVTYGDEIVYKDKMVKL